MAPSFAFPCWTPATRALPMKLRSRIEGSVSRHPAFWAALSQPVFRLLAFILPLSAWAAKTQCHFGLAWMRTGGFEHTSHHTL